MLTHNYCHFKQKNCVLNLFWGQWFYLMFRDFLLDESLVPWFLKKSSSFKHHRVGVVWNGSGNIQIMLMIDPPSCFCLYKGRKLIKTYYIVKDTETKEENGMNINVVWNYYEEPSEEPKQFLSLKLIRICDKTLTIIWYSLYVVCVYRTLKKPYSCLFYLPYCNKRRKSLNL